MYIQIIMTRKLFNLDAVMSLKNILIECLISILMVVLVITEDQKVNRARFTELMMFVNVGYQ